MRSRLFYVIIVAFLVAGAFLVMRTMTDTVASQTTDENTVSRSEGPELEMVIGKLRDKEIRKSSPKELVEAIDKARMIAGANTFSDKDSELSPPKLYSPELLSALIALLDWEQPKRNDDFDPAYGQPVFPAIDAIAVMRKAALPSMVEVLENESKDSLKYQNALKAVRLILHRDDIGTINFLRAQASASKSEKGKERLLFAADIVQKDHIKFQQRVDN